ncbi:hypothetical protein ABK040_015361 [Willaertia magna]
MKSSPRFNTNAKSKLFRHQNNASPTIHHNTQPSNTNNQNIEEIVPMEQVEREHLEMIGEHHDDNNNHHQSFLRPPNIKRDSSHNSFSSTSSMYEDETMGSVLEEKENMYYDTGSEVSGEKRPTFGSPISFLFASIGASIGLGDLIKFPHLMYNAGGGAFLIPYCVCLFVLGIPMALLEFSLGHMAKRSSILALSKWNRRACGVGLAMIVFGSLIIVSYYNVILSWICVYFVNLFQRTLPWTTISAEDYFNKHVLQKSTGLTDFFTDNGDGTSGGFLAWPILLCLVGVTILNFLCVFKGVSSIKIVSFVTVPLPVVLLFIFFLRTIFFETGSKMGIYYFFKPNFEVLKYAEIWLAAAGQVFFSIGIGNGVNIAYSSHLSKKSDVVIHTCIVVLANCAMAFICGMVVFAILGVMAADGRGIDQLFTSDTAKSGLGLAFVVYMEALSHLPAPHFSALLLILTLFSMGIDSAFACVESIVSNIKDYFTTRYLLEQHRKKVSSDFEEETEEEKATHPILKVPIFYLVTTNRSILTACVCVISFILGIPFTFANGYYLLRIVDHYTSNYILIILGLAECIVLGYFALGNSIFDLNKEIEKEHGEHIEEHETEPMVSRSGHCNCCRSILDNLLDFLKYLITFPNFKKVFIKFKADPKLYWRHFLFYSIEKVKEKITLTSTRFFPYTFWSFIIKYIVPIILGGMLILTLIFETAKKSDEALTLILGWGLVISCVLCMIFFAIFPFVKEEEEQFADMIILQEEEEEELEEQRQFELHSHSSLEGEHVTETETTNK